MGFLAALFYGTVFTRLYTGGIVIADSWASSNKQLSALVHDNCTPGF
jgi:hypothetical protein